MDNAKVTFFGVSPLGEGTDTFCVPILLVNGKKHIQLEVHGRVVLDLCPIGLEITNVPDYELPEDYDVKRPEPLYAFRSLVEGIVVGNREEVADFLRTNFALFKNFSFLSVQIAEFIQDEELITDSVLRAAKKMEANNREGAVIWASIRNEAAGRELIAHRGGEESIAGQSDIYKSFSEEIDPKIIERAQKGDMNAHSDIYRLYSRAVLNLARGMCRDNQIAEDILHNTFIKLIDRISAFQFRAPFGLWLRQLTVNESLTFLRKMKRQSLSVPESEMQDQMLFFENSGSERATSLDMAGSAASSTHSLDLEKLLRDLPQHVRLILWLKEVEGYTHNEIAAMIDRTPNYSNSVVARAKKYLTEKIELSTTFTQSSSETKVGAENIAHNAALFSIDDNIRLALAKNSVKDKGEEKLLENTFESIKLRREARQNFHH